MRRPVLFVLAAGLVFCSDVASGAAGAVHLVIAPPSTMILNGSSNVASWRCTGRTLSGAMDIAAPLGKINEVIDHIEDGNIARWMLRPDDGRFPQPRFEVKIAIASLRCSGGRRMEADMKRALKADRFDTISFDFSEVRSPISHDIDAHHFEATIAGRLSLAGVDREISFAVVAGRVSRTQFWLTAELPVRMSDFGVTPSSALMGMVRAADALSVRFDLILDASP